MGRRLSPGFLEQLAGNIEVVCQHVVPVRARPGGAGIVVETTEEATDTRGKTRPRIEVFVSEHRLGMTSWAWSLHIVDHTGGALEESLPSAGKAGFCDGDLLPYAIRGRLDFVMNKQR